MPENTDLRPEPDGEPGTETKAPPRELLDVSAIASGYGAIVPTRERVLRRWRVSTTNGLVFAGPLTWADNDPSQSGVPPESVTKHLADVFHIAEFPGFSAPVTSPLSDDPRTPLDAELLWACVAWSPLTPDPTRRRPRASIEVTPECYTDVYDLLGFDRFIEQLRTRVDALVRDVRPVLAAAMEEDTHNRRAQGVLEPQPQPAPPCA